MLKIKEDNEMILGSKIRRHFDLKSSTWYYSIVDIIEALAISTDARNYWKVLKNRLKKTQNELVTKCNRVKMISRDGKSYLTDVADSNTLLTIIQNIKEERVGEFRDIFNQIEETTPLHNDNFSNTENELSTITMMDEAELVIDAYQNENIIIIKAMLAGVEPHEIFIEATCRKILIKGNRKKQNNINEENYNLQELFWGKFSREIILSEEIDIDRIETTHIHGLLTLKLFIIDKTRTKIIKIK